jgi:hypothetical protein
MHSAFRFETCAEMPAQAALKVGAARVAGTAANKCSQKEMLAA